MRRFYGHIAGNLTELACAEIEALCHISSRGFKLIWKGRVCLIESHNDISRFLLRRSAFLRSAGEIIAEIDSIREFRGVLDGTELNGQSFRVRSLLVERRNGLSRGMIESEIGQIIKDEAEIKVNLVNPDITFLAIVLDEKILISKANTSRLRQDIVFREPGMRRFFHPSIMNARLARSMCNLAGVMPYDIVLDPFSGAGGILCEAADIGAHVVGIDLHWGLLKGAKMNLAEDRAFGSNLIQADSRLPPIASCDCIVTDPPYGRGSSTRGSHAVGLIKSTLTAISNDITVNGKICICGSMRMNLPSVLESLDIETQKVIRIPVHGSLVREIIVAEIH